jgi:hypothetical protein
MTDTFDPNDLRARIRGARHRVAEARSDPEDRSRVDALIDLSLLQERHLDELGRNRGDDDYETIRAKWQLATTRYDLGDVNHASELLQDVTERLIRTRGPDDRATIDSQHALASTVRALGDYTRLEAIERGILGACVRINGSDDVVTNRARCQLADTQRTLGKGSAAAALWARAVKGFDESIGPGSRETIEARMNLALMLFTIGNSEEGQVTMNEARGMAARTLDQKDPTRIAVEKTAATIGAFDRQIAGMSPVRRTWIKALRWFFSRTGPRYR